MLSQAGMHYCDNPHVERAEMGVVDASCVTPGQHVNAMTSEASTSYTCVPFHLWCIIRVAGSTPT
jgi:hypothetical protein